MSKEIFNIIKKHLINKKASEDDEIISSNSPESIMEDDFDIMEEEDTPLAPDEVDFTPETMLAVTQKLLALNRGYAEPDNRDALYFRKAYTPADHLRERIKLDAGKAFKNAVRKAAYRKNLNVFSSQVFNDYSNGLIVGNSLSMPLEEINPMQLVEQSRRFTQMGPGGIGSTQSITEEAQNVDPSEFGFIDAIAGPESEKIGIDTRAAFGTKLGSDGRLYQRFFDRRNNQYVWLNPLQLHGKKIGLPN